jgi:hypothetical protein
VPEHKTSHTATVSVAKSRRELISAIIELSGLLVADDADDDLRFIEGRIRLSLSLALLPFCTKIRFASALAT